MKRKVGIGRIYWISFEWAQVCEATARVFSERQCIKSAAKEKNNNNYME